MSIEQSPSGSEVPTTTSVAEADPVGPGNDLLRLGSVAAADLDTGSDGYVTVDGAVVRSLSSTVALSEGGTALTVTVAGACSGPCQARGAGGPASFTFVPSPAMTAPAGNAAAGSFTVQDFRLF